MSAPAAGATRIGATHWSPSAGPQPPGPRYIALGDSYASGQGTGAYQDRACFRSDASHPHLLAAAQGMTESFTDVTCGGAELADLTQANPVGVRPQLAALLGSAPEMVTLTIGGNDLGDLLVGPDARGGIGGVLAYCFVEVSCQTTLTPLADASRALTERLTASYEELAALVPSSATVYVIGYPQIFPGRDEYRTCFRDMPHPPRDIPVADWMPRSIRYYGWDSDEIAWLRTAVETLNASVRNAVDRVAASAGAPKARVLFVDVSRAFAGSPLCAPRTGQGDRPVRGLLLDASKLALTIDDLRALYAGLPNFAQDSRSGLFDYLSRIVAPESFHPTIEGQRRIATCAIGRINAFRRDGSPMDGGACPAGEQLQPS
jgi:GDSL-like lipase/acylhydrolase family protein